GWAYFRFAGNPLVAAAQFNQQLAVPISAVNLAPGYVAHFTDHDAVLMVATKRGQPAIKPEEIKAVLDLADKGPGIYNVPVQLVAPDVAVQSLSPASVTLSVERIQQRAFSVGVRYVGTQSGATVVSQVRVDPSVAMVRGATSLVAQVASVAVNLPLPAEPKAVDEMVRPVPLGAGGEELTGLTVTPNLVRVQMRVVAASTVRK
ncbi:MAG: hypothetical protein JO030_08815, partial [Candidatus Eremiobacteraeota bacterium]|nr:hypothetical protein [Candidatus Eremiobacteraeota bacterium]